MARPRVYKRPHVDDPKLKKILQQIDDEFSNLYAGMVLATGPTGPCVTGPTGPTGADSVVTGPTGPSVTGPTGPAGPEVIQEIRSVYMTWNDAMSWLNIGADLPWVWVVGDETGNDWEGHEDEFAEWVGSAWVFSAAEAGELVAPEKDAAGLDTYLIWQYIGSAWRVWSGPTGPTGPTGAASTVAGPTGATGPTGPGPDWELAYVNEYNSFLASN